MVKKLKVINFKHEEGYGLLFLLLFFVILVPVTFPILSVDNNNQEHQQTSLRLSKQQLLNYARSFPYRKSTKDNLWKGFPPLLPCPDLGSITSDGSESGACGRLNVISLGKLPWKSLDLDIQTSSKGECLWYVVSGNVKRITSQASTHFNEDSDQWLFYKGTYASAALLAPSKPSNKIGKSTNYLCRDEYDFNAYFDFPNPTETADFLFDLSNLGAFDVLLITRDELISTYLDSKTFSTNNYEIAKTISNCLVDLSSFSSTNLWTITRPAPITLSDDRQVNQYKSDNTLTTGRFPLGSQLFINHDSCSLLKPTTNSEMKIKQNYFSRQLLHWKTHWFLKVMPKCNNQLNCLSNTNDFFIAMIVFADKPLNTQKRTSSRFTSSKRSNLVNYLEGNSLAIFMGTTTTIRTNAPEPSNDLRYCISTSLHVSRC